MYNFSFHLTYLNNVIKITNPYFSTDNNKYLWIQEIERFKRHPNFINYYSNIKFKCVDIKYHSSTNQVKYMLFEQITS